MSKRLHRFLSIVGMIAFILIMFPAMLPGAPTWWYIMAWSLFLVFIFFVDECTTFISEGLTEEVNKDNRIPKAANQPPPPTKPKTYVDPKLLGVFHFIDDFVRDDMDPDQMSEAIFNGCVMYNTEYGTRHNPIEIWHKYHSYKCDKS